MVWERPKGVKSRKKVFWRPHSIQRSDYILTDWRKLTLLDSLVTYIHQPLTLYSRPRFTHDSSGRCWTRLYFEYTEHGSPAADT